MIDDDSEELAETAGMDELAAAWDLFGALVALKTADPERARGWAIAATDAERLYAWIGYLVGQGADVDA